MTGRYLIVNADDFGLSRGVNRGIVEAHDRGIVTSASLMVRGSAAEEAAAYALRHPAFSVGLHVDLGEWICRDGEWSRLYDVVPVGDDAAVVEEVERQLVLFEALLGRPPTHIDSHQHVHRHQPVRDVVQRAASRLDVPVRELTQGIRYDGSFYGQDGEGNPFPDGVSVSNMVRLLRSLPEGITELGCHPGFDDGLSTMYRSEREREVATICDPRVRAALVDQEIELTSFSRVRERVT